MSPESVILPPLRNLQTFNSLILGDVPLFQVETILTAPEIILHPNTNEIDKMCVHCAQNCMEITKVRAAASVLFHRWLIGTGSWVTQLWKASCGGGGRPSFHSGLCPDSISPFLVPRCRSSKSWTIPRLDPCFSSLFNFFLCHHDPSQGFS